MSPHSIRPGIPRVVFLLGVLPAWCVLLFALRVARSGQFGHGYLLWNLALAMAPMAAALMLVRAERERAGLPEQAGWFAAWLLVLPNAPYLVTDLVHLGARPPVPLWFDVALMLSYACTGLLLGFASLADVHAVVARRFGAVAGWIVAEAAMLLSGSGIYMGRFLRWNSWDALTRPHELIDQVAGAVAEPGSQLPGMRVTLVYGIGLALGYAAVHLVVPPHASREPDATRPIATRPVTPEAPADADATRRNG